MTTLLYRGVSSVNVTRNVLQIVQNRALRPIGGYDRCTRIEQLHSRNETRMLKNYINNLELKLYVSAKANKKRYVQTLGSVALGDKRKVPKPSHILRYVKDAQRCVQVILPMIC